MKCGSGGGVCRFWLTVVEPFDGVNSIVSGDERGGVLFFEENLVESLEFDVEFSCGGV